MNQQNKLRDECLEGLTVVVEYPTEETLSQLNHVIQLCEEPFPAIHQNLKAFYSWFVSKTREELEEHYTATFELQGRYNLGVGFVLFGEDYKRGEFLVNMQQMMREYDVELGTELADHLPTVVKLVVAMTRTPYRKELVEKIVLPAINKMLQGSSDLESSNPYARILKAFEDLLSIDANMDNKVLREAVC